MSLNDLTNHLKTLASPAKAKDLTRFFKTGPGQYGEGDIFLGIMVPQSRAAVAKYWRTIMLPEVKELLQSQIHEFRLVALLILVKKFEKGSEVERAQICKLYLQGTASINNWDLVDLSAPNIVGNYLLDKPRDILYQLVHSNSLWERRISVLATFAFIRDHDYQDSLQLAELLFHDPHDLIHKATGWMLREVGKRDLPTLLSFLDQFAQVMPRTMLRYSIEKLDEPKRQSYLVK